MNPKKNLTHDSMDHAAHFERARIVHWLRYSNVFPPMRALAQAIERGDYDNWCRANPEPKHDAEEG